MRAGREVRAVREVREVRAVREVRGAARDGAPVVRDVRETGRGGDERGERVHVLHDVREDFRRARGVQRGRDVREERAGSVRAGWTLRAGERGGARGDTGDARRKTVRRAVGLARAHAVSREAGD